MNPWHEPVFGISLTLILYITMTRLHKRWKWVNPLFFSAGCIILFLLASGVDYTAYQQGGEGIAFFLGPATVALAIPLVKQIRVVQRNVKGLFFGIALGSLTGIITAGATAWMLGAPKDVILTLLPKSVTTPISIELAMELGGIAGLTAVFTSVTGLLGNLFGYPLMRFFSIRHPVAKGGAMGTAAHGIGTAKAIQSSPLEGGTSGLAMALAGICTSVMLIPLFFLV